MTDEELNVIATRADTATPGPWEAKTISACGCGKCPGHVNVYLGNAADWNTMQLLRVPSSSAEFIAHARTDVPALIAEVERLRSGLRAVAALPGDVSHGEFPRWARVMLQMNSDLVTEQTNG